MTNTERFIEYAMGFEQVLATDDWSSLERFFTEDAVHHAKGGGPLAVLSMGRDDVIAGLHHSVAHLDRRFDRRRARSVAALMCEPRKLLGEER